MLGAQGQGIVDAQSGLTKVVLARRSDIAFKGHLDPLLLLAALQVRTLLRWPVAHFPNQSVRSLGLTTFFMATQTHALGRL